MGKAKITFGAPEEISGLEEIAKRFCCLTFSVSGCDGELSVEGERFDVELFCREVYKNASPSGIDKIIKQCVHDIEEE